MNTHYDYSRHKICISLAFDYSALKSKANDTDGNFVSSQDTRYQEKIQVPSFLYNLTSKTIIARGGSADKLICETKESPTNLFYVRNVFIELYNTYLKQQGDHYEENALDDLVLQETIQILQQQLNHWIKDLDCSKTEFCYAFTIPTHWSNNTREELIRPLFVKSGLIHEEDDVGRLLVFTELELAFRYMQSEDQYRPSLIMNQGHQYVIMSLDFQQELHVSLRLVSAQYPGLKTVDSIYIPQLLKDFHFKIPFGFDNVKLSLTTYLERFYDPVLVLKLIDPMLEYMKGQSGYIAYKYSEPFEAVLSFRPFKKFKYTCDPQFINKKVDHYYIKTLTLEDVLDDWFHTVKKNFMDGINTLLQGTDNIKTKSLIISYTDCIENNNGSVAVLKLVEKWAKMYSEEQSGYYHLIANNEPFSYKFCVQEKLEMLAELVRKQMQEFNMSRDPVILNKNSTTECGSPPKSVIFFNIDLLPTENKITLTYVNEKNRVKQIESIDCNIQPLYIFFKQSELYQRLQLHINNKIKTYLETLFADYLTMYSKSNQKTKSASLLQPASEFFKRIFGKVETKSTFGDYLRIHTSRNWSKEIRHLFASSRPHPLEGLMKNVKMDGLFALNDNSDNGEEDLLVTSDPGYIFFFMVAYLHNLKLLMEKELKEKFGNDLRGKNIWYGVSVDKDILETVFVSKKKLEKLFYASGILLKDKNLRRAKFCVRGEEILPAIQQTLDLNMKMKSYFVVAQIFPQHVQLTLHQTVKLASPGEDAASIIIEDKIVYFDDVYDALCKTVWKNMKSNCQIDYCIAHKDNQNTGYDFGSFQAYRDIHQTLKQRIVELLKNDSHNVDMNVCTKLNIGDTCSCLVVISLRFIIEIGLQPVIESIARTIASTLANYDLFGNYKTDHLFVSGDPFQLSCGSRFYTVYTTIFQKAMNDSIQSKGKDTQAFVMKNPLDQLRDLSKSIKPHMFDRFINGTLCQVPSNTYGVRFYLKPGWCFPFIHVNGSGVIKKSVNGSSGNYLIFIEKGKPLSTIGTMIKLKEEKQNFIFAEIIRTRQSSTTKLKKYDLLDWSAKGTWDSIYSGGQTPSCYDIIIECKHLNYNYSLEFTMRRMNDYHYPNGYPTKFRTSGEPLTLAYL